MRAELPSSAEVKVVLPKVGTDLDSNRQVLAGLRRPIGTPPLEEFVEPGEKFLLIVNDATRSTPTSDVIAALKDIISFENASILVATGAHPPPDEKGYRTILGHHLPELMKKTVPHKAELDPCHFVGTTSRGTEVFLNNRLFKFKKILVIGSVEPHYFAGFTGGRKSIVPGVASLKTIEMNHSLAVSPEAAPLRLAGNPVHEDLEEAAALLNIKIFSISIVLDGSGKIYRAETGDLTETFKRSASTAMEVWAPRVEQEYDVAVTVCTPPLDSDLYQAQKAIENVSYAVKRQGMICAVSPMAKGAGPQFYADSLGRVVGRPLSEGLRKKYCLGDHKHLRMARLAERYELCCVSELDEKTLLKANLCPFSSLQDALDRAVERFGPDLSVLVVPEGGLTVPVPQKLAGGFERASFTLAGFDSLEL